MNCIKIIFETIPEKQFDLLLAKLSVLDHNGMEEGENSLAVFFDKELYPFRFCEQIAHEFNLKFQMEEIQEKDWNEIWEANFQPLIIEDFCSIRAHFHPKPQNVAFDIVITPKMSFGTGHHATTFMVISMMKNLDFRQKHVFDFGTGTGILAILAKKLGAESVMAIDTDKWSIDNAQENFVHNEVEHTLLKKGSIDIVQTENFDIILANINRSVLLDTMSTMGKRLKIDGHLLLSGILKEDVDMVISSANNAGLELRNQKFKSGWAALQFSRSDNKI